MKWTYVQQEIDRSITKYSILTGERALSNLEVIDLWKNSKEFRSFFTVLLQASQYRGYFWEVKPVQLTTIEKKFEFVLIEGRMLVGLTADYSSFKQYFKGQNVVSFANLGKDATLIVPESRGEAQTYAHLAKFIRNAPSEQIDDFWKTIGTEFGSAIGQQPKWLSTAGLGVYWLHVRIDSTPKYYRFSDYKSQL